VDGEDVHLLDAGGGLGGDDERVIAEGGEGAAVLAEEADGDDALFLACFTASMTLGDLPLVESAKRMSSFAPREATWREKTRS
jgi:hypothetical protein